MRILYFSNSTSMQGGAELNLLKICKYFNDKYEIKIVLPNKKGIYKLYLENGMIPIVIDSQRPTLKNGFFNLAKFFLKLPITIFRIRKIIIDNKIEIVHTNDIIDFPAMIATKLTKAKLVSHLRFIIKENSLKKYALKKIYLKCSDRIICVSKAVKENWFPDSNKALVIYNGGPELKKFKKSHNLLNTNKKFRIITVGKLVGISGHENIINAIANIREDVRRKIELTIVGGSVKGHEDYEKKLKDLVNKNHLNDKVFFIGYTSNVAKYLNNADLFVFTPTWEHAFPTVVLEAMAMELPIIAYDKGGIREQIVDNKNGFLVNSIPEISEKIIKLVENEKLLKDMGEKSLEVLKKNFSLKKHFIEIERLYKQLLKK